MSSNQKHENGRGLSSSFPIPKPKKGIPSNKRVNPQINLNTNKEEVQNCSICKTEVTLAHSGHT